MPSVKIIGAGQLGSRHLQALQAIKTPLEIQVVDPFPASLATAKERFEAVTQGVDHVIDYRHDVATGNTDVAIVATGSNVRRSAVEQLVAASDVRYLVLEKLLFDEPADYAAVGDLLAAKQIKTWVNCPMRVMGVYEEIRQHLGGAPVHYRVTGSQFGLVTNAIHYLDHVCHLTGESEFSLDTSGLDAEPIASKRAGFLELTGTLLATFADGSRCEMTCHAEGNVPVIVEISSLEHRFIVRESEGKYWHSSAAGNWQWSQVDCSIPFQSQITADMVRSLLGTGDCGCTPFDISSKMHLSLLEPLRQFLAQKTTPQASYPFT